MGLFDHFPYTNFHEINLMWILEALKEIQTTTEQFVTINSLKYADPIQWNITSQYEKNTIVIDPQTGTAYISVQPVPTGVALSNEDYWTVVFDLSRFIAEATNNLTSRVEGAGVVYSTFNTSAGQWLVWNGILYRAITDIAAGTAYTVDLNIQKITIEEIKDEIYSTFNGMIGNLADLTTTDKSNLVAAVNEVLSTLGTTAGDLADLDTTAKNNLVAAVNEVLSTLGTTAGDLADLDTTAKNNLVAAINEVYNLPKGVILNVKDYGATGDGITNDYQAILNTIAAANDKDLTIIYFPNGSYYCGMGTFNIDTSKIQFLGAGNSELISNNLSGDAFITLSSPVSLKQYDFARVPLKDICIRGNYFTDSSGYGVVGVRMGTDTTFIAPHCILENVTIRNFAVGLELSSAYKTTYLNCSFIANNRGVSIPSAGVQQAVPCIFVSCWWECNNYAFYTLASGFNSITIVGGAFEYNRSIFTGYTKMVYLGVRFEYDAHASCEPNLAIRPVINLSPITGSQVVSKFIGCFFLELNNFVENVQYWISTPYVATNYNSARIYGTGGDPVTLEFVTCEFESINTISGYYYIATDKYYGVGNYSKSIGGANMIDPSQVVTGANGFIS